MKFLLLICLALVPALAASKRIVGGGDAPDGRWPWQLSQRNGGSHSCGASLIRADWAVSAAHCVGGSVALYEIIAGTNNRNCPNNDCEARDVTSVTRHEDFSNIGILGFPNDVAVINFASSIAEEAGKIAYATMATGTDQLGATCFITGWGRLTGSGILPVDLQEAQTDILTEAECHEHWSASSVAGERQVCVYDKGDQSTGACNGDSGGPLVCQVGSEWELVGATSWGANGCSTSYPSVYTRISYYQDWILRAIGE